MKMENEIKAVVEPDNDGSLHAGHRQRMKNSFLRTVPEEPVPHELLEMLLYYSIPRGDVNPLAHRLIERFGSLTGVLEASAEELCSVPGVGENTACLIRLTDAILRASAIEQAEPSKTYETVSKLDAYLRPRFAGLGNERVYLVMLDNGMRMIDCVAVADGVVNNSVVCVRRIAELCLNRHAACAVLAHNHPHGMAIPSSTDIEMTSTVDNALDILGIPLLEHLIITEHACFPILRSRKGMLRSSPITGEIDEAFYETFYRELM